MVGQQEEEQKAQNKAEETATNQTEIKAPISETAANEINHDDKEEIVAVSSAVEAETPTNTSELAS